MRYVAASSSSLLTDNNSNRSKPAPHRPSLAAQSPNRTTTSRRRPPRFPFLTASRSRRWRRRRREESSQPELPVPPPHFSNSPSYWEHSSSESRSSPSVGDKENAWVFEEEEEEEPYGHHFHQQQQRLVRLSPRKRSHIHNGGELKDDENRVMRRACRRASSVEIILSPARRPSSAAANNKARAIIDEESDEEDDEEPVETDEMEAEENWPEEDSSSEEKDSEELMDESDNEANVEDNANAEEEVEMILGRRKLCRNKKIITEYFVKWKGWERMEDRTWETYDNLKWHCQGLINAYNAKTRRLRQARDNTKLYEVERILSERRRHGKLEYRIKWCGYEREKDLTWEPAEKIRALTDVVAAWEREKERQADEAEEDSDDDENEDVLKVLPPVAPNDPALVCSDISKGKHPHPIAVLNAIDVGVKSTRKRMPHDFKYTKNNVGGHVYDKSERSGCGCPVDPSTGRIECMRRTCQCRLNSKNIRVNKKGRISEPQKLFDIFYKSALYECSSICACRGECSNRITPRRPEDDVEVQLFKRPKVGFCVRTCRYIKKGTFVGEYVGEVLSEATATYHSSKSVYVYDVWNQSEDEVHCIDSAHFGNFTRFLAHACFPNLVPIRFYSKHRCLQRPSIGFVAWHDIPAGTELSIDYGKEFWAERPFYCECDAPYCIKPHPSKVKSGEKQRNTRPMLTYLSSQTIQLNPFNEAANAVGRLRANAREAPPLNQVLRGGKEIKKEVLT